MKYVDKMLRNIHIQGLKYKYGAFSSRSGIKEEQRSWDNALWNLSQKKSEKPIFKEKHTIMIILVFPCPLPPNIIAHLSSWPITSQEQSQKLCMFFL